MKTLLNILAIFFALFAAIINAQYVVTVVQQEIVTVTYNPVQTTASTSGNNAGFVGSQEINEDDEETELGFDNENDEDLNGRINARQTGVPTGSFSTKTKAMTNTKAQKTGASSSNSAASLKASMLVGSLAMIALLSLLL